MKYNRQRLKKEKQMVNIIVEYAIYPFVNNGI